MPIIIPASPADTGARDVIDVANQAARLALPDDEGQLVRQNDDLSVWVQVASPASVTGSWELVDGAAATSTAISPAADDAVGAIGTQIRTAREDHKHPAQAVSADANNLLVDGTDGLAQLPLDPAAFAGNLVVADDTLQEVADKFDAYLGMDRLHLTDTLVAPATAGTPLLAEIIVAAGTARDTILYYTGDDLPASAPTYVYHTDKSGAVTLLQSPGGTNIYTADGALAGARVVTMGGNDILFDSLIGANNDTHINDSGNNLALSWADLFVSEGAVTGVPFTVGADKGFSRRLSMSNTSTGDIPVQLSGAVSNGQRVFVIIENNDVISRNAAFTINFNDIGGTTLGTVAIPAGTKVTYDFLVYSGSDLRQMNGPATGGATIFDKVQDQIAMVALTGMVAGDMVEVQTPAGSFRYDGAAWQRYDENQYNAQFKSVADADLPDLTVDKILWGNRFDITATAGGAPSMNIGFPQANFNFDEGPLIQLSQADNLLSRSFVFDPVYKQADGVTPIGTIVMPAAASGLDVKTFQFARRTLAVAGSDEYHLIGGSEFSVSAASGDHTEEVVTQASHGFTLAQALYHDGTNWKLAQGDVSTTVAQGIVTTVTDVNTFTVTTHGVVTATAHGLTIGEYYWLDQAAAGLVTLTQPTIGISQSLLHVRDANTLFVDVEQAIAVGSGVVPTPLHYASMTVPGGSAIPSSVTSIGSGYSALQLGHPNWGLISDAASLINAVTNSFDVVNPGKYEIICAFTENNWLTTNLAGIYVDGVLQTQVRNAVQSADDKRTLLLQIDLASGQRIEFGSTAGDTWVQPSISIKQLPTATVVDPGFTGLNIAALDTEYATGEFFLGKPIFVKVVDIINAVSKAGLTPGVDQTMELNAWYTQTDPSTDNIARGGENASTADVVFTFTKSNGTYALSVTGTSIDSARLYHKYTKV